METKGHGTIKKSKALGTVGVLALATTLTIGTGTVFADDVAGDVTTSSVVADNDEATVSETPTVEQVDTAKAQLDEANKAVSDQEQVVTNAETDVANAEADVADATETAKQAQTVADQATDENISNAETNVANAETDVANAETNVANAETDVANAETNIAEQQTKVDEASQNVSNAETNVANKEQNVKTAQDVLDGTGASDIIAKQAEAQTNFDNATNEVNQATSDLENAKKADSDLADATQAKEAEVQANTQAENQTKSDLDATTQTATETAEVLKTAEAKKAEADNTAKAINTVVLSDDYVNALKGYYATFSKSAYDSLTGKDSTASERTTARAEYLSTLSSLNSSELANNGYVSNENDKTLVFTDLNNLPEDVRTQLSLFASDLINQIRTKFGTQLTSVTSSSVKASDLVTDGYVSDDWGFGKGHDAEAIDKASEELGAFSNGIGGIGENLNSWSRSYSSLSLDNLKKLVYQSIIAYMLNGKEWLHASSIAGLSNSSEYIGADISVRKGVTSVHVNDIENEAITSSDFSKDAIENPYDSSTILAKQAEAQSAYETAKAQDEQAQSALATATEAHNTALANLTKSEGELEALKATPTQTEDAERKLQEASNKLATAEQELANANEAVDNLNADIQTKTDALNQAKAELEQAKTELEQAKADLETKQADLEKLQNALVEKQNALTSAQDELKEAQDKQKSAQDYLSALNQAPAILAQAQANLESAQANLAEKEATYEKEYTKLLELKEQQAVAQSDYDTVYSAYREYLDALKREELAKQYADIVSNGGTPVAVTNENGEVIGYVVATVVDPQVASETKTNDVANVSNTTTSVTPVVTDHKALDGQQVQEVTLPETGDKNSASVVATGLGLLLTAFGLADIRRKKSK